MATVFTPKRQPGVGINQRVVAGGVVVPATAALPSVLIGLKKLVLEDVLAGTYETGSANEISFPGVGGEDFETGAKVYADTIKLVLKNIVFAIVNSVLASVYPSSGTRTGNARANGPGTASNSGGGSVITGVGTTFTTTFVVGDNITIGGETKVISIIGSNTSITVVGTITGANSGVVYQYDSVNSIYDATADFVTNAKVNDFITLTHASFVEITVRINSIDNAKQVTVNTTFPAAAKGASITYIVKRHPGEGDGDILTDSTSTDPFEDVFPGDLVDIVHPTQGKISAVVLKVIDTENIQIDKDLDTSTNVQYTITRANATFTTILDSVTGSFNPTGNNTTTDILRNDDATEDFSAVEVGDKIRIIQDSLIITEVTVIGIVDVNQIQLSKSYVAGTVTYTVIRITDTNAPYDLLSTDYSVAETDDDGFVDNTVFTLDASITIGGTTVKTADVYADYIALSTKDANTKLDISDPDQIPEIAGINDINNHMGVCAIALQANTTKTFHVIPIAADTNQGWLDGIAAAEKHRLYSIIALTQNATYQSYVKTHVNGMGTLLRAKWRLGIANLEHIFESVITPAKAGGILDFHESDGDHDEDYLTLYDPVADFSEAPIDGFIKFVYTDGDDEFTKFFKITARVNTSKIEAKAFLYAPPTGVAIGKGSYIAGDDPLTADGIPKTVGFTEFAITGTYTIFDRATKEEQAQLMAARANSYGDRKFVLIANDQANLDFNGVPKLFPGYVYCAALGGIIQETEPHQPITNFPFAGFIGSRMGNNDFGPDENGVLAAGGNLVMLQDVIDQGLPYPWQGITTSTGDSKSASIAFNKNLDEHSYALYDVLRKFPGNNNLVAEAQSDAETALNATLEARKANVKNSPVNNGKLGAQLQKYEFNGFIQDTAQINRTFSQLTLTLPTEWNYIDIDIEA